MSTKSGQLHTVGYGYDLDGRRDTLYYPPSFAPYLNSGPARTAYAYDTLSGWLHTVTDPTGNAFTVGYIPRGDPDTLHLPLSESELKTWDNDGNLITDYITGTSTLRNASIRYDGRGKSVAYKNAVGTKDTLSVKFSGLGNLVADSLSVPLTNGGGDYLQVDANAYDGLGDVLWVDMVNTSPAYGIHTYNLYGLGVTTGRLTEQQLLDNGEADSLLYDASGNMAYNYALFNVFDSSNAYHARADYYSAEERLAGSDARQANYIASGALSTPFREREWYRYDAFGRRVLIAAIDTADKYTPSRTTVYNRKLLRRVAWDGSQEIAEVQVQDTSVAAIAEMDTGHVAVTRSSEGTDNNSQYGQVLFTFGAAAIDQPLSITRVNYADASDSVGNSLPYFQWPIISVMPLWNTRGRWDTGIFPEYYALDPSGKTHSLKYNLQIGWQGYTLYPPGIQMAWHGSLLNGKQNETGTVYKRARVYDPTTSQFTQEDPLGLGGGLNAYGFANGDPLNYDDPFGTCPPGQMEMLGQCQQAVYFGAIFMAEEQIAVAVGDVLEGLELVRTASKASRAEPADQSTPQASFTRGEGAKNAPRSTLPRGSAGEYLPDPAAEGPHTTLGTRQGSDGRTYTQGATFDENGNFQGRTDVTNHGRPTEHPNPHYHPATGPASTGGPQPIPSCPECA